MDHKRIHACFDGIAMPPQRRADLKAFILNAAQPSESAPVVTSPRQTRRWTRRLTAVVLAVVMLCSVGAMAAYYGLADKFDLFSFAEKPLDADMQSILEQYGASIDQSMVINGVTVTAEAYLADKTNLHILYSLEFDDVKYLETFQYLRDFTSVYITDAGGRDLGHIVGGASGFVHDPTPGKHYFTKTFALAGIEQLSAGSQITLRFTSDQFEATEFDLDAYIDQYTVQTCSRKDAVFHPVSFERNGITYTVQALVTSGNDLSICYTIDRKETAALSEVQLMLHNDGAYVSGKMLGGLTAFDRDGQLVYVRGFAISPEDLTDDAALYITDQHDLTFDYHPNPTATAYLADTDFDGDAVSRMVNGGFSAGASSFDGWNGDFHVDTIEVTPLSVTFTGTCRATVGMSAIAFRGYGDTEDYYGLRFLRADGTYIHMSHSSIEARKDGTFTCTMLIADPIDPTQPLTIESVETGEAFTLG